eukprot:g13780.t1
MELVETAYPEAKFDTPDARPALRAVLDNCLQQQDQGLDLPGPGEQSERRLESSLASTPLMSFRCPLPLEGARLRVRLPRRYPAVPLVAAVEGTPMLTASARKAIADSAAGEAARLSGELRCEPQCLQVLGEAMRAASDLVDSELARGGDDAPPEAAKSDQRVGGGGGGGSSEGPCEHHACAAGRGSGSTGGGARSSSTEPAGAAAVFLGRRLIYSHHIIATQKRTGIVKAARELGLGGFSKVGWPGVIVIEGEESSCEDFVGTLRGWRWKHLAVRGEEKVRLSGGRTLDQERLLPLPLEELGEREGVSALAARCREAGLGELFSTLLR